MKNTRLEDFEIGDIITITKIKPTDEFDFIVGVIVEEDGILVVEEYAELEEVLEDVKRGVRQIEILDNINKKRGKETLRMLKTAVRKKRWEY